MDTLSEIWLQDSTCGCTVRREARSFRLFGAKFYHFLVFSNKKVGSLGVE